MAYAVLTRDADASARYAHALAPLEVVAMPVTRTDPPADPAALRRALETGPYAAIACASPRAAEALGQALAGSARGVPEVWAVGAATARVLAAAGLAVVAPDGVKDAASLAHAMITALAARGLAAPRVLVPRAEDGREEGLIILRAAGVEVVEVVAYRTVAVTADEPAIGRGRALLASGGAALCVVFAPSQVTALDALVGIRTIARPFIAIGETTARALRAAGAGTLAIAAAPTPEGVANAVAAVYPDPE